MLTGYYPPRVALSTPGCVEREGHLAKKSSYAEQDLLEKQERALAATARTPARRDEITIKHLLSYRMHILANAMSGSAAIHYRKKFDVSIGEWRTIALLGAYPSQSQNQLARAANLDKGHISRVIKALTKRGIVQKADVAESNRQVRLSLTSKGRVLYDKLMEAARTRNDAFLACLSSEERDVLDTALTKLASVAKALGQAVQDD